jgi:hypothetical protein
MNFRMNIETDDDDYGVDGENLTTIFIIVKVGEYEILRSDYNPIKISDSSFSMCAWGPRITILKFNEFIEKMEQNMSSSIVLNCGNNITFANGSLDFKNSADECFQKVSIPIVDQDTRNNFVLSFRKFLDEIKSLLNI